MRLSGEIFGLLFPGIKPKKDTWTEEEKFYSALLTKLRLTSFPVDLREQVFKECVKESEVRYTRLRTTYHSKLDDWPEDNPLPFWLGVTFAVGGFLGSFAYSFSALLIRGTVGTLFNWVKTGAPALLSG